MTLRQAQGSMDSNSSIELSEDGRWHCPYCGFTTQLVNKASRHLSKKHGDEWARVLIEVDTAVNVTDDEEE